MNSQDFATLNQKLKQILTENQQMPMTEGSDKQQVVDQLMQMGYKPANLNSKAASKKLTPEEMQHTVVVGGAHGVKHFVVVKDDGSWYMKWINAPRDQYGHYPAYTSKNSKLDQLDVYWMED